MRNRYAIPLMLLLLLETIGIHAAARRASADQTIVGAPNGSPTLVVGTSSPTTITNIRIYTPSLTPSATSAAIQTATQTFAVTGVTAADTIHVVGPTPTSLCPMVAARVSATDQIAIDFTVLTAAICTPASGTYRILAVRS